MVHRDTGEELMACWGPLPHKLPVQRKIARAELHAVLVMLRNAQPPVTLWVDCQLIIDGVQAGQRWATSPKRQHADIWRDIWWHLDDMGSDVVDFKKVKAHQSKAKWKQHSQDMQVGLAANHAADAYAKRGASEGNNVFLAYIRDAVNAEAARCRGVLDYISAHAIAVADSGMEKDVVTIPKVLAGGLGRRTPNVARRLHQVRVIDGGIQCKGCFKVASRQRTMEKFAKEECEGNAASRLALDVLGKYATSNGHRLWKTGPYVWCGACGCFTARRIRGLGKQCPNGMSASNAQVRANLANGKAPKGRVREPPIATPVRVTVAMYLQWRFLDAGALWSLEDLDAATVVEQMSANSITCAETVD